MKPIISHDPFTLGSKHTPVRQSSHEETELSITVREENTNVRHLTLAR